MKSCFIFFVLLIQAIPCFSQVTLPSFFGDNMVLQQNDSVAIWGSDIPNSTITISASWLLVRAGVPQAESKRIPMGYGKLT